MQDNGPLYLLLAQLEKVARHMIITRIVNIIRFIGVSFRAFYSNIMLYTPLIAQAGISVMIVSMYSVISEL